MRSRIPKISGQWLGHFKYGPEYGNLYGEVVNFSLVLDESYDGQFQGKCYELDGIGANDSVSFVKGYVLQNAIHFVKEYTKDYELSDDGTVKESGLHSKPILTYDGEFDYRINSYTGQWELEANLGPTINGDLLDICTGTWEMIKVNHDL